MIAQAETGAPSAVAEVASKANEAVGSVSQKIYTLVEGWGLPAWLEAPLGTLILLIGVVLLSLLLLVIIRPIMLRWIGAIIKKTPVKWDDYLLWNGVPRWTSHFLSGLIIHAIIPGLFSANPELATWLLRAAKIYMIISGFFIADSLFNTIRAVFQKSTVAKKMPASSVFQLLKVLAALVAIILVVSVLAGQTPGKLIAGLGAMTAILMLVFKDPILGFISGIQLAANKMIAPGDWIEMPKHGIDGDVLEVGMTTVKIRNFDKTISTVPTQALIADSFKNWRGMQEAGGRRIKRCLTIDLRSVKFCTDWMLKTYSEIQLITEFVDAKIKEVDQWNEENGADPINKINGRRTTNLGMFRAYIQAYLEFNPNIRDDMTLLVRQLQPSDNGLPIEIYCFTKTTDWNEYEAVQADIFDHLIAATKEFELEIFQHPTRLDTETVVNMHGGRLDRAVTE